MSEFEFDMKAIEHDGEGYYYPRWDQATPVTARGETKQEAINKAARMLGDCPRGRGWYWGFKIVATREVTP